VLGVYVHIPFCQYRCTYCDFATYAGEDEHMAKYVSYLVQEIDMRAPDAGARQVTSIFFGGGTPSRLPVDDVARILQSIGARFSVAANAEVTLEANPGTLDPVKLRGLRQAGVNRLSIGVQTLDDAILARVNRIHDAKQALQALRQARAAGFESVSADLIFGLPGQDKSNWTATLRGVLAEEPDHLSAYGLILEPGTMLRRQVRSGALMLPPDDDAADMYDATREILAAAGYMHYEISNWARPGHRCRHNLLYWEHAPYLGVGLSAHSYVDGIRFGNVRGLQSYMGRLEAGKLPTASREVIDGARARADAIMLGLRLMGGIHVPTYDSRFGGSLLQSHRDTIDRLSDLGLLEIARDYLRLSERGYLVANQVWQQFL
jgi:oxygen-independent coproporphyrinogen-3 oxidase